MFSQLKQRNIAEEVQQTQKPGYNAHDPGSCPNFTFAIVTTTRCHHLNVTIPTKKGIYLLFALVTICSDNVYQIEIQ